MRLSVPQFDERGNHMGPEVRSCHFGRMTGPHSPEQKIDRGGQTACSKGNRAQVGERGSLEDQDRTEDIAEVGSMIGQAGDKVGKLCRNQCEVLIDMLGSRAARPGS